MDSSSPRSPLDDGEIPDDDPKEFDDGFDENLMGDDEDKRKLAQMTEKQREEELFKRSERRETLKIRFEIERKLRAKSKKRKQEEKQSKQIRSRKRLRASEIYSSDESSDDSDEYVPDPNDKSSAANDLNTTGGKSTKMNTRQSSALLSSSSSASASPSSSSSSDSEPERDNLNADDDGRAARDDFQMTLADLKAIQLKRDLVEQWLYSPFFKEVAVGLYVKISIGQNPTTSQHIYKVAQITDIIKGNKVYALQGEKYKTDKQCQVKVGNVERTYKLFFISNRSFDEEDYNKWRVGIDSEGHFMPSREHFMRKRMDLKKAMNYQYTNEDVAHEIEERKRYNQTQGNFAMRKTELIRAKAEADDMSDYEKAHQIQLMIDELETEAKELEAKRTSTTFTAISFVNERNRYKNIQESERVLKESKAVRTEDPFTRRKCTPTIVHNIKTPSNNNNSDGAQGDFKVPNDKNGQTPNNKTKTNGITSSTNGTPGSVKSEPVKSVNDLFHAHASIDIDLDLDI